MKTLTKHHLKEREALFQRLQQSHAAVVTILTIEGYGDDTNVRMHTRPSLLT